MAHARQLAAIMFTDIEGYTAIMQENEQQALVIKDRHREILQNEHSQYNGRIIQYYGDGTLSIFQSAIQAVQCALAMQLSFRQSPNVPLRIAIHIGEIIFDGDQVFGDGINLASRIETLGVAGCVLISDRVKEEISNQPQLKTVSVGSYRFKNIQRNVEVFALDHEDLVKPAAHSLKGKTEEANSLPGQEREIISTKSIAVLPFLNMSNDPEQEYFSDGIAEEIINSISHLQNLKVAGRLSSFQFKGKNMDLREVGEKLGVTTVLGGSVRKYGNRLRITAQLTSVHDGFQLWSERYDRDMNDIFAIQDDISLAITEKLKLTLLENEMERITKSPTYDTEAYKLYLKGRFYLSRRGSSILKGKENFQKAIVADPAFAMAYAGFADANIISAAYGLVSGKEVMSVIKDSAETAIMLDNTLCEPYCSLGAYYVGTRNWIESKKNFARSIELDPKYAQAYSWYGMLYFAWVEGNFNEAEKLGRTAIKLEPLSAVDHADLSWSLYTAGKFEESLLLAKTGIELDANSFLSWRLAGLCYLAMQRCDEAINTFKHLATISDRHQHSITGLIWSYCSNKNYGEAGRLMNELRARSHNEYIAGTYFGLAAAWLGEFDNAFELLQNALDDEDLNVTQIKYSRFVPETLRNDERFQSLLDRIGYPS